MTKQTVKIKPNNFCSRCRTHSGVLQPRDNNWKQGYQPYKEYICSSCNLKWSIARTIKKENK